MEASGDGVCTFDYEELQKILLQRGVETYITIRLLKNIIGKSWRCHRKSYRGSDRCIFHAEEKDHKAFETSFYKELERMEKEDEKFDFIGFIFPDKIDLKSRVFGKSVFFTGATFRGPADFSSVTFQKYTDFTGAEFQDEADFTTAEFQEPVSFNYAKFKKGGNFVGTKFQSLAGFKEAEFEEVSSFREVTFDGDVYFIKCRINSLIDFSFCTFNKQVLFRAAEDNQGYLLFFSTIFREPKITYIIRYPLSRVSFLLTDVEGIYLIPARAGNEEILDEKMLRIVESEEEGGTAVGNPTDNIPAEIIKIAKQLKPYLTPETVHAEYKLIRKCLEANRMFTEAADLFIKEMRLARKLLRKTNVFERLAHHIYEFVSRYGESVNRPIILAIATTLLASILLLLYNPGIGGPVPLHLLLTKYLENLEAVSAVFFQVRSFKDFSFLAKAPIAIEILIRVLAIIIFGNLFVAVRRRLERH